MRSGKLRHLINIQRPGALDANFQPNPEWEDENTNVPARVEDVSGSAMSPERFWDPRINNAQLAQMVPTETHRVTLRYLSTLDATRRIIFGARVLEILPNGVLDPDQRHIWLIVTCRERLGVTS